MSLYEVPIKIAIIIFLLLSVFLFIPWLIYSYRKYGYLSIWSSIVAFSFIFYMLTALFLVILPLPTTRDTCSIQSPDAVHRQLIPFYFIQDMWKGSSVVWSQPATYTQLFKQGTFMPTAFNFLLLMPLGVYLRYFLQKKHYWKCVFLIGFLVSLFFEVTQLTGIYGIYNCPYRLFDVDDLILNSGGSLVGFLIAPVILALFPSKESVFAKTEKILQNIIVLPVPQLLALFIDYFLVKISWFPIGLFLTNSFIEVVYKTAVAFIVFVIVPVLWNGKTIGSNLMRYRFVNIDEDRTSWVSLLKRFFALYLPWVVYKGLQAITNSELDSGSSFYKFHVWINVGSLLAIGMLLVALLVHIAVVIFSKGHRLFYFDYVSNIVPRYKKDR